MTVNTSQPHEQSLRQKHNMLSPLPTNRVGDLWPKKANHLRERLKSGVGKQTLLTGHRG